MNKVEYVQKMMDINNWQVKDVSQGDYSDTIRITFSYDEYTIRYFKYVATKNELTKEFTEIMALNYAQELYRGEHLKDALWACVEHCGSIECLTGNHKQYYNNLKYDITPIINKYKKINTTNFGKGFDIKEDKQPLSNIKNCSKMVDMVNSPKHYKVCGLEVIDIIEDLGLGFHLGNTLKYVCRAGKKDPDKRLEDLKKAQYYLNRYIQHLDKK